MTDNLYARYDEWKGWGADQFMVLGRGNRAYFDAEFAGLPVRGEKALEIGFGSGTLLAWLRERGAEAYGTELSPQGVALARERGVTVLDSDLSDTNELQGRFGIVAAFDVLEHLSYGEIDALLARAAVLLRPGGCLVARFPNGASPFGGINQHGDITHVTTLSKDKISQLMMGTPFELLRARNSPEVPHGGFAKRVVNKGRGVMRKGFELGLAALYGFGVPFGPNLTVVLRRK